MDGKALIALGTQGSCLLHGPSKSSTYSQIQMGLPLDQQAL